MKREFLSNILFLLGVNLLVKPLYLFGIDRNVQNILPEGEYGLYAQLLSLAYLLQIVADLGIQNYNNRQIAQHRHLIGKYFSPLATIKFWLGLLFMVLVFLASLILGYWQVAPGLVIHIACNQLLLSLLLFLRSNVSGLGYYRWDSFLSILDKLIMILLLGAILWLGWGLESFQLEWFIWAQTLSFILPGILALFILGRKISWPSWRIRWSLLGAILKQTFPYALVILLMTLYTRIDMVMVGRLLPNGNQEADLYASAYRLLDAANMLGFLFATLLLPMFSRQLKRGEAIGELTSMGIQYIWAGAIPLAMSLIFFRTPIMEALYVNGSSYSGRILAWLMGSFLAVSGSYIYGTLLTAHGSLMAMNRIFLWGVLGNVGLNFWLIPRYQAEGAAMATCLTQFFVFVAQVFLSIRRVNLAPKPRLLARLALFLIICSGIAWWVSGYLSVSLLPGLLISLGCGGLAAITLRILDVKEAFHLLLNKNGGERGT